MANKNTQKIYEVSFHLIPTLDEKKVSSVVEDVKGRIAKEGEVLSEESPKLQNLAYTIRHNTRQSDGSYARYDEAYFGSIKFKALRNFVKKLHQDMQDNENILRLLILETVEENTRIGEILPGTEEEEKPKERERKPNEKKENNTKEAEKEDDAETNSDKK